MQAVGLGPVSSGRDCRVELSSVRQLRGQPIRGLRATRCCSCAAAAASRTAAPRSERPARLTRRYTRLLYEYTALASHLFASAFIHNPYTGLICTFRYRYKPVTNTTSTSIMIVLVCTAAPAPAAAALEVNPFLALITNPTPAQPIWPPAPPGPTGFIVCQSFAVVTVLVSCFAGFTFLRYTVAKITNLIRKLQSIAWPLLY